MEVAGRIARFVVETQYEKLPPQAIATAKTAVLDCLGVALAGSREECGKICAEVARHEGATQESTVFGHGFRSSALHSAFVNGTAAHALDFDHSFTLMGQPTAPLIPAVFALGEACGASGRQIIAAYAAGFETTAKLAYALAQAIEDGWHAPSALGSFGATAACATLLGLSAAQIEMALGITASMTGGVAANFGTMTKPLHAGLGARNGVLAAKLAQNGYTANAAAIEAGAGFFKMFYSRSQPDEGPLKELGSSLELVKTGIRIKPYPCGGLTHPAIDAVLDVRAKHNVKASDVDSIHVDVGQHTYNRIVFRVPETGLQGKFSMNYLLARALIDGKVSLDAFSDSAVRDTNILKLAEKVSMSADPSLKPGADGGRPCRVTIRLINGQTHYREAKYAKGSPEIPMAPEELKTKFIDCARRAINEESVTQLIEHVDRMETLEDIRPLCQLLRGA